MPDYTGFFVKQPSPPNIPVSSCALVKESGSKVELKTHSGITPSSELSVATNRAAAQISYNRDGECLNLAQTLL